MGSLRKLHNVELHDLYYLPNIIWVTQSWRMKWAGHVAQTGKTSINWILMGKPEGQKPLGRPGQIWENIKLDV
jgi:hypothetical protein